MLESNKKPKYNYSTYKIEKTKSGDSRGHENDFPLVNSEQLKSNLNTTNSFNYFSLINPKHHVNSTSIHTCHVYDEQNGYYWQNSHMEYTVKINTLTLQHRGF